MTDAEKAEVLRALGVTIEITGDVMTLNFKTGMSESWLAASPMMLECDAWRQYEAFEFGGRTWIKCEGIV